MLRFAEVEDATFLWWIDLIATSFSFIGSLWMIVHCFKAPSPKSLTLKLIAAIGMADFLYSVSNILSNFETDIENEESQNFMLCEAEAILRQAAYVLSIFFSTCVAIASYFSACPRRKFKRTLFFYVSVLVGFLTAFAYIKIM